MESINILKGYDKVDSNLENQNPHPHLHPHHSNSTKKPIIITLTISAILLLTLIITLTLAALIHESNTEPPESIPQSNSAESIRTICNLTRYPTSCFTSISSLNVSIKPDPEAIFNLSLQVSIQELKNVSTLLKTLNDVNSQAAINDCSSQFDDALGKLGDSLLAMKVGPGEKALTLEKINDIQTWISAAMTDQQTCIDGLEEMESVVLDEVKAKMVNCNQFLSNSLAIIAKMQSLLEMFDLKLH
ncbi:enzyme inhibitor, putative [Ricinus communis]|uniref:pectinesterase n=1 Tax=Ricinus communis TaxID=3988 RepID=B9R981_RICCO|nr:enzyme inhibitor, putative [Ricinus communis]|eukprot:XP_002511556.1 putative pectinesterase/pectinesterase inhibitor 26 [Ricinus communis]